MTSAGNPADPNSAGAELLQTFVRLRTSGRNDAAYCVAHAGHFLLGDQTPPDVREYAVVYHPNRPRRARAGLDDASWLKLLYHHDDDPFVGKVFETVLVALRRGRAKPLANFGLSPRDAIQPGRTSAALVRALGTAAFGLNVPMPLVFARPTQPGGLAHVPSEPIATVAGSTAITGLGLEELAFIAAQHMAMYRPDHYVATLIPSVPDLTTAFLAALKVGGAELTVTPTVSQAQKDLTARVKDAPATLALLKRVVTLFVERGENVDLVRWRAGVLRTSFRAGLLMSGDLAAAKSVLSQMPDVPSDALADLTTFAMSEAYFTLRQITGIALWPELSAPVVMLEPTAAPEPTPGPPPVAKSSSVMPPPSDALQAFTMPREASALKSVEISLDELNAPPDGSLGPAGETSGILVLPGTPLEGIAAPPPGAAPVVAVTRSEKWDDATARDEPRGGETFAAAYFAALQAGDNDKAYCIGRVWAWREANLVPDAVRAMLSTHRWSLPLQVVRPLGTWDWSETLRDHDEDTLVGHLLASLAVPLRRSRTRTPEDYGLDRSAALTTSDDLGAAFLGAARALAIDPPMLFKVPDLPSAAARPPCDPAVLFLQPGFWGSLAPKELAFAAAEQLAYFRADRHARILAPTVRSLSQLAVSVHQWIRGAPTPGLEDPFIRSILDVLASDPVWMMHAKTSVDEIVHEFEIEPGVRAWCDATERTAARAAILLSFDFEAASKVLRMPRELPAAYDVERKLAALETFAMSDAFATLRRTIETPA